MSGLPAALSKITIGDLSIPRPTYLVSLSPFQKIGEAVNIMLNAGISACLCRSADFAEVTPSGSTNASYYCGMIDLLDIVAYFAKLYAAEHGVESQGVKIDIKHWTKTEANVAKIESCLTKFNASSVAQLLCDPNFTLRYSQVRVEETVLECAKKLGPGKNQRLLVVDDDFNIVNIITQTSLLHYVSSQIQSNPALFKEAKQLLDLPLSGLLVERPNPALPNTTQKVPLIDPSPTSLYTVKSNQLAIETFEILYSKRVTGVAVVDAVSGTLIGNISQRDIRSLVSINSFEKLSLTALEYLELIKEERMTNASKLYIKRQQYIAMNNDVHKGEELKISPEGQDLIAVSKTVPPLPSNTLFDNVSTMSSLHENLPSILTVASEDTVGYLLFTFLRNRVRRVYLTSGRLLPNCHTTQVPVAIVTLSDLMLIFSGQSSTLSF